jgi:predicted RNase H-like nuclease (RuvC/YqgF family)
MYRIRIARGKVVDKVYKKDLPALRNALEELRESFSNLSPKTDWTELRIEPLLKHLRSLEQLLESEEFSQEISRLTKGVELFHSDLVYFRTNVRGLEKVLQSEKKFLARKNRRD